MDHEGGAEGEAESCFYICPIGKPDSPARKRSNQIYQHVVKATLEPLGYTVVHADHLDESGVITSQIIGRLINSDLVVADLTDHNPNVFYELAVRHAVAKPFIQLIADNQQLPFDIQGLRAIHLDHHDLDSVHEARTVLSGMVASIRTGREVETPLTFTLNLQSLRRSEDSEARGIADIISELEGLKQVIRKIPATPSPSSARGDTEALKSLMESLIREGRADAEDLRGLIYNHGPISKHLSAWVSQLFSTYIPDERPF